ARADCVISMGGYNNVCELLASRKKALVVPRVTPRREQWIRAERLQRLGALDVCHPDELCTDILSHWLAQPKCRPSAVDRIDLGGLQRIPSLVRRAVGEAAESAEE
ncbi:MAG TPA: hypothetical protein VE782_12005, partial [Myxococcaceae bacterium]|nr:hypothetical protein [Myxococcaceae bacterium]